MKQPLEQNAPVNNARFDRWLAEFAGYTAPVTRGTIELWLKQFDGEHEDTAARVLDAVLFFGNQHIRSQFQQALAALPGWHRNQRQRKGRWFFCAFSSSSGESGDSMIHQFRMANGLTGRQFSPLFVHRSELVKLRLTSDDTVVLIDDFSGSGTQAIKAWPLFEELLSGEPNVYLVLVAATTEAVEKIGETTPMSLCVGTVLNESSDFFSEDCTHFSAQEKKAVESYCKRADKNAPYGFSDSGLLVVFSHRCPNNSLPILHARNQHWDGLFPRHLE